MEKHPIIEVVSEETKVAIRDQVTYLEKMSKEAETEEQSYFEVLLSGAKTVISILENLEFPMKGTQKYLESLNIEQLKYAKTCAERLLKEKESKGVVSLYCVETSVSSNQYFLNKGMAQDAFVKAVCEEVKERNPMIEMTEISVPYDEIGDYVGEFQAARFYKIKEQESTADFRTYKTSSDSLPECVLDSKLAQAHLKWKKSCNRVISKHSGFKVEMPTTVRELHAIGKNQKHALSILMFIEPIERGDSILFSVLHNEQRFEFEVNLEQKGIEPFEFIHKVGYCNATPPDEVISVAEELRDVILKVNKLKS